MYIFLICWIPDFEAYPEICLLHINHPFQDPDPILGFSSSSSWPIYGFRTKRVYMGDTVERWQYLEESRQDRIHLYNIIYICTYIYIEIYQRWFMYLYVLLMCVWRDMMRYHDIYRSCKLQLLLRWLFEFCSFLYRGILKGMLPYKFTNQNHSFTTIYTSTVWISKKGGTGISVEVHVARWQVQAKIPH